jgi:hypothetical protein
MNELDKALKLYEETFDDSFPTIPLLMEKSDEEVIQIINKCVEEDKDVYEMKILSLDGDIIY